MEIIRSLMSVRWIRRTSILVVFVAIAFLIASSCTDDDCFFGTIELTADDVEECEAAAADNSCDDFEFVEPDECTGFNCEICVIIDDDDFVD